MNERIHELRKAMYQFAQSAYALNESIESLDAETITEDGAYYALANEYPFETSFEEMCADISAWFYNVDGCLARLEKGEQK